MTRRVNIKAILVDKDLRRKIMIPAIMAIQKREGINISYEQAERAYDKVQIELRKRIK